MNNFYKTRLIYKSSMFIAEKRAILLQDTGDLVRYSRRIKMLIQLSQFEHELLTKIQNFESDDPADFDIAAGNIEIEVHSIINSSA